MIRREWAVICREHWEGLPPFTQILSRHWTARGAYRAAARQRAAWRNTVPLPVAGRFTIFAAHRSADCLVSQGK